MIPFSLCNAPATFERLMEEVLRDLILKTYLVYLDDVIIYGKSFTEMLENLKKVFLQLRKANMKLNLKNMFYFERM